MQIADVCCYHLNRFLFEEEKKPNTKPRGAPAVSSGQFYFILLLGFIKSNNQSQAKQEAQS